MKPMTIRMTVCPRCGRPYSEPPALSRKDNMTHICPDCGTREALTEIGVAADEQEQIIEIIHNCKGGGAR